MALVSLCVFDASSLAAFSGYLLPAVRSRVLRAAGEDAARFTLAGAVWDGRACAAAAAEWDGGIGHIVSLFVDPQARRQGIAGRVLDLLAEEGVRRGADKLDCNYILREDALAGMDALFLRRGAEIKDGAPVYGMQSRAFLDSPLLGAALRPGFLAPPEVAAFSGLSPEQLRALDADPAVPAFVRPSARQDVLDPDLSCAWISAGRVIAYALGCQSGEDMFDQTGVWRAQGAPEGCLRALIQAQVNRCWYRCGGDFQFFLSAVSKRSAQIAEWFTGGRYEIYAQHEALLSLAKQ